MKMYSRIALLAAFALLLTMAACSRPASTAPVASPTPTAGEVGFPVVGTATTGDVNQLATQTAIAQQPQQTQPAGQPQVDVATATPTQAPAGEQPAAEQPVQPTAGPDQEQGGGQAPVQPTQAPPAPAANPVNTPVITRPATYTLQRGEWPLCIARRYDLDHSSFLALNGMNMYSEPGVGTVLQIPSTGSWSAGPRSLQPHPTTYTVSATDTVYTIACRFGDVAPESILAVNGFDDPSDIQPGTTINIP